MSGSIDELVGDWDYARLPDTIAVGPGCWIERRDSFKACRTRHRPGLFIGPRSRLYTWCAFNLEEDARVNIGEDCILTGAVLMCTNHITIGNRVRISYNVTIADSDFHPLDAQARMADAVANRPLGDRTGRPVIPSAPVVIEDDVEIGLASIILKGVTIGRGATLLAGAVVSRDVPAGATVAGNPAKIIDLAGDHT